MDKSEALRQHGTFRHVHTVRERPLLFIALTVCLFVVMAFGATAFTGTVKSTGSIQATLRAKPIDIDRSSETPAALIKPRPFDPDSLISFLLNSKPLGATLEQEVTDGVGEVFDIAFERGDDETFTITLGRVDNPERFIDRVNDRIETFVERLNLERAMQRELASSWINRSSSQLRAQVDEAKAAITLSPFDVGGASAEDPFKTERLLRLMIDATVEAKTNLDAQDGEREIAGAKNVEVASLTSDVTRLTSAMASLEQRHAAQFEQVKELKAAEEKLTRHLNESEAIQAPGGPLSRPAAIVLAPAAAVLEDGSLGNGKTAFIWVAMLALSLLMAALGTMMAGRYKRTVATPGNIAMLNNPNWPLPPGANRELSG